MKKENLVIDMKKYLVDIASLQKTKIKNGLNSENITCFPTKVFGRHSMLTRNENKKWCK